MTVLCDWQIKQLSRPFGGPQYSDVSYHHVVEPFVDHQVREDEQGRRLISYGLSSFGYDVRLAPRLLLVDPGAWDATCLDPKDPDGRNALVFSTEILPDENGRMWMPPHSFALGCTVERFDLPTNVMGVCLGKSTYARNGIIPHVTPLEPGWQGYLTLEFSNNTPRARLSLRQRGRRPDRVSRGRRAVGHLRRPRREVSGPARRHRVLEGLRQDMQHTSTAIRPYEQSTRPLRVGVLLPARRVVLRWWLQYMPGLNAEQVLDTMLEHLRLSCVDTPVTFEGARVTSTVGLQEP